MKLGTKIERVVAVAALLAGATAFFQLGKMAKKKEMYLTMVLIDKASGVKKVSRPKVVPVYTPVNVWAHVKWIGRDAEVECSVAKGRPPGKKI